MRVDALTRGRCDAQVAQPSVRVRRASSGVDNQVGLEIEPLFVCTANADTVDRTRAFRVAEQTEHLRALLHAHVGVPLSE